MIALGQIQNLAPEQAFAALESRPQGLSAAEAAERLREIGRNSAAYAASSATFSPSC